MLLAESCLTFKHRGEALEERVVVLAFQLSSGRDFILKRQEMGINRVELSPSLGVRENIHGLLNAFEKRVVVGLTSDGCLFIGVMFKHFLPVYMEQSSTNNVSVLMWQVGCG